MSAPSPMGRTAILIVALAAGLMAFASDAPTGTAHPHRKAATARARHQDAAPAPKRAGERRHSHASRSAPRPEMAHSALHSSRRTVQTRTREARSSRARASARRASLSHHRGVTAEQLRRVRELEAEREADDAPKADRKTATSDRIDSARIGANPAAAYRPAIPEDTADAAPEHEAAQAPDPREDESSPHDSAPPNARALMDPASFDIPRRPAPLRGSLASLERQDERLEADGLDPILDDADLSSRIAHHLLIPVPVSAALTVNPQLPAERRYCRPWTARFLADLAHAHQAEFHRPFEVSSAVRTVEYQQRLMRINGNAAPAEGDVFSPHLMGATVDISKKDMSQAEITWMRRQLLALELAGKIDVEEEFEQACFHITVYKSYAPPRAEHAPNSRAARNGHRTQPPTADTPATAGSM